MKNTLLSLIFSFAASASFASTESMLAEAQALGAPMTAVKRALSQSRSQAYMNQKYFAVFDIAQPAKNKRFFLFDIRNSKVTSYYIAHGKGNGDNFRTTHFRGFQKNFEMTPLGPLRTAVTVTDMEQYRTITDKYTGRVYSGLTTLWVQGMASYNAYINDAMDGFTRVVWIAHPAWYVTEGYRRKFPGGLGRSLGCLALDPRVSNDVFAKLQGGALIYVAVGDEPIEKFL